LLLEKIILGKLRIELEEKAEAKSAREGLAG
jgi:hypothetical protein